MLRNKSEKIVMMWTFNSFSILSDPIVMRIVGNSVDKNARKTRSRTNGATFDI
jgi:hypothetical protein